MNIDGGLDPYLNILHHALVRGREEDFENGIELLEIIFNATDEERIEPYAQKFLGLLVRTLNYRRDYTVKAKMIELIDFLQDQPAAKAYSKAIVFTYVSLLDGKIAPI